jgi:hypothetical protein
MKPVMELIQMVNGTLGLMLMEWQEIKNKAEDAVNIETLKTGLAQNVDLK